MIKSLARKEILKLSTYQPGRPIDEVKRELKLSRVIKLASNENAFGASPKALAAGRRALLSANRYPDGSCFYLRKKLARKFGLEPGNIIFGNGSDEIITMVLRAFVNPGETVIVASPTFLIYALAADIAAARVISVPLKGFRYDLPAMRKRITPDTKVIFIANPDNPTGSYATAAEVTDFINGLPPQVIVVFDEAYYEFAAGIPDYPRTQPLLQRMPNLVITRSFSKAYGLSGLRIGYGLASAGLIECLEKVREPFNVNSIAQAAALAALDDPSFVRKTVVKTIEGKKFLCDNFKKMELFYVPSATNFILVRVPLDSMLIYNKLLQKGVIVREMSGWGLKGFIRVTVGKPAENRYFVKALKEALA